MVDNTLVFLENASLSVGDNSRGLEGEGLESVYFCLTEIPSGLSNQDYTGTWNLTAGE